MNAKTPLTVRGAELLRAELHELKTVQRPAIIAAIAEARSHGDLSENAEYHAAREQQSFCEGRINELEHELSHSHIIDVSTLPRTDRVVFGATVHLETAAGEEVVYQIVGEHEADVKAGKISIASPIARAMISKEVGDVVEVNTPGGVKAYEILKVEWR